VADITLIVHFIFSMAKYALVHKLAALYIGGTGRAGFISMA
jgi:hypothetical protein